MRSVRAMIEHEAILHFRHFRVPRELVGVGLGGSCDAPVAARRQR
jgi:hypothetical protein